MTSTDDTRDGVTTVYKVSGMSCGHCVARVERALNAQSKAVNGAKIGVLGVSYKAGVGDLRESPALRILQLLRTRGADVAYHDPHVPELPQFGLRSAEPSWPCDLAVIVTAHPQVDHERIAAEAPRTLDLRGVTRRLGIPSADRL